MFLKKLIAASRWGSLSAEQLKVLEELSLFELFKTASLNKHYRNVRYMIRLRGR